MATRAYVHQELVQLALAMHDAADAGHTPRGVRLALQHEMDLTNPELIEDLLISASALLAGIDPNIGQLVRTWTQREVAAGLPLASSCLRQIVQSG